MEEAVKKDENAVSTISLFLCYAREDESFLVELEKHLTPLKRQGFITSWHDREIRAGTVWEQAIQDHLDTAQLILLLISPGFMSSDYCYGIEMVRALERQRRGEARVIPILLRPVDWQIEPLGSLQALPEDARPITLWSNRDAAFFDVEKGIRRVIEDIKARAHLSPPFSQLQENAKNSPKTSVPEEMSLPEGLMTGHETRRTLTDLTSPEEVFQMSISDLPTTTEHTSLPVDEHIFPPKRRNPRQRRLLVSLIIFLMLAAPFIPLIPRSTCTLAICRFLAQQTSEPSPTDTGEIHDQNLSVELVAVMSPSFLLPDDPKHYAAGTPPPTDISAVLLPENPSTYDTIVINVRNLRHGGSDIIIDSVALKLLSIPVLPRPLRVWTPGVSTTYPGYFYPVAYTDQQAGQLLYAHPPQPVILTPARPGHTAETDALSLKVMSSVPAYLQFQVQITYQITGPEQTLILPRVFQVVFSDASNWQQESL